MNTVLYLCYGRGMERYETLYSIISAMRLAPPRPSELQYVVYSDHPEFFARLGVVVRRITLEELESWSGSEKYQYRRKTFVLLDALKRYPGKVAFVDCDTYFMRSPEVIFQRIGPGRSCLHIREARLLESGTTVDKNLSNLIMRSEFRYIDGSARLISPDAVMWNSGVIGLHSSDICLIGECLSLIDQFLTSSSTDGEQGQIDIRGMFHIEQFATGVALESNIIKEGYDVVFHYWDADLRDSFRSILLGLIADTEHEEPDKRSALLYSSRPQSNLKKKMKQTIRKCLRSAGVRVRGIRANA